MWMDAKRLRNIFFIIIITFTLSAYINRQNQKRLRTFWNANKTFTGHIIKLTPFILSIKSYKLCLRLQQYLFFFAWFICLFFMFTMKFFMLKVVKSFWYKVLGTEAFNWTGFVGKFIMAFHFIFYVWVLKWNHVQWCLQKMENINELQHTTKNERYTKDKIIFLTNNQLVNKPSLV